MVDAVTNKVTNTVTLDSETLTEILQVKVQHFSALGVQVANAGNALDQFVVSAQYVQGGSWVQLYQEAADYTSLDMEGILRQVTADVTDDDDAGDITVLADAETGALLFDRLAGVYAIKLEAARAAGADTTLTVTAQGY